MSGPDAKADLLRNVPLFSTCSEEELRRIAGIADELNFREGTVLTRQGSPGREMFVLIEGTVDVVQNGRNVNTLGAGDFLGEGTLILRKPRNATITATSPIRALVITDMNFRKLLDDDPAISDRVRDTLAGRMPPEDA